MPFVRVLSADYQNSSFQFKFDRQAAGSHEIWFNEEQNRYTTIPRHPGDIPEGTLKQILKQAGVAIDDFLSKR